MNSKKLSVGDFSRFSIASMLALDRDGLRRGSGERMLLSFRVLGDLNVSLSWEPGVLGEQGERERPEGENGEVCDRGDLGDWDFFTAPVKKISSITFFHQREEYLSSVDWTYENMQLTCAHACGHRCCTCILYLHS